ncbi:hypothetical protein QJS10_CPB15g01581 [Acorus calamus]|uniref:Uncharacterized protein n=1 Tax=Acorus calamus TaxID=4465 RepID=A0AAV9D6G2_ACOCL|nr:hypothetical protein QJS10_CPB15g01581 [Acorus calamus]
MDLGSLVSDTVTEAVSAAKNNPSGACSSPRYPCSWRCFASASSWGTCSRRTDGSMNPSRQSSS